MKKQILKALPALIIVVLVCLFIYLLMKLDLPSEKSIKQDKFNQWQQLKTNNDCQLKQIDLINNVNKWYCNKNKVEVINNYTE